MLGQFLRSTLGAARGAKQPELSVIVCSVDDRRFAECRATWQERLPDVRYELIRISDARSLAEGYNRGLARSRAELLVFCHDDIELLQPDACARIVARLESADVVGVAGTSRLIDGGWHHAGDPDVFGQIVQPARGGAGLTLELFGGSTRPAGKPIQALDGVLLAMHRGVAEALRFDAGTFDGFHLYDIDFTYRAYLAGLRLAVCHDLLLYHKSLGDWGAAWQHYCAAFQNKYAARLSKLPPGAREVLRFAIRDTAEALTLFEHLLQEEGAR